MLRLAVFALLAAAFSVPAWSDSGRLPAHTAVELGRVAPLEKLFERVRAEFPGRIIKLELEDEDGTVGGWVYEVKILRGDGVVIEVEYDAVDLRVLEAEGGGGWRPKK